MTIYELADMLGSDLIIRRYANQKNRFTASFEHAETKPSESSSCLTSEYGNSHISAENAISDYVNSIRGKWLVINAMLDSRKEFGVPESLTIY